MDTEPGYGSESEEERPPFFRTWKSLYAAVIFNLVLLIVLFYCFTRYFA